MDHNEYQRLKQLANDSIIATFGRDNNESRLAVALEQALERVHYLSTAWHPVCPHCNRLLKTYDQSGKE